MNERRKRRVRRGEKEDRRKEIGEKEKIGILLAEYGSLRSEINARVSTSYQLVGFVLVSLNFLLQQTFPSIPFVIGATALIFGGAYCFRMIAFEIYNPGIRVKELETEINRRAGREKLLIWENERGGLTPGYRLRALLGRLPPEGGVN